MTSRNNQRMYLKPITASDKFGLPDPSTFFSGGAKASSSSKSKSSSDGKASKDEPHEAMYLHSIYLDQEKNLIDRSRSELESKAYDLLSNKYNGDLAEFQRGEYEKFKNGEGFYADMQRIEQADSRYKANKLSAKVELDKWKNLQTKAKNDEALNMVIEDDFNNPYRSGNGKIYQMVTNNKGGVFYVANDGQTITKEEGDKLDYLTMQDYLKQIYFTTGYTPDGVAAGPTNYFETYDMKSNKFMTEIKDILSAAAGDTKSNTNSNDYLVGKGQVPMDTTGAKSVHDAWTFLQTVERTGYSNVKSINAAIQNIEAALSPEAKRDLRQQLYKARRSGEVVMTPPNIKGESKALQGEEITMDAYLYNLAVGRASGMYRQGGGTKISINMLNDFNADGGSSIAPMKMTTMETIFNPAFIKDQGSNLGFSYINRKEGTDGKFEALPVEDPAIVLDNFLVTDLNDRLLKRDQNGKLIPAPTKEFGIREVLAPNGQWIDVSEYNSKLNQITGRVALMPAYLRKDGRFTQDMQYEYNEKGEKVVITEPYMEVEIEVGDVNDWADKNIMYGQKDTDGMWSNLMTLMKMSQTGITDPKVYDPNGTKELRGTELEATGTTGRGYMERQLGATYKGLINKEATIKVWVNMGSTVGLSGVNARSATAENKSFFNRIRSAVTDSKISNLAK